LYREILQREVTNKIQPTDAEIRAYFDANQDRFFEHDFAKAIPYIRNALSTQRRPAVLKAFTDELRAKAKISIDEKRLRTVTRQSSPMMKGNGPQPGAGPARRVGG
jgi:hypothetical protein